MSIGKPCKICPKPPFKPRFVKRGFAATQELARPGKVRLHKRCGANSLFAQSQEVVHKQSGLGSVRD